MAASASVSNADTKTRNPSVTAASSATGTYRFVFIWKNKMAGKHKMVGVYKKVDVWAQIWGMEVKWLLTGRNRQVLGCGGGFTI